LDLLWRTVNLREVQHGLIQRRAGESAACSRGTCGLGGCAISPRLGSTCVRLSDVEFGLAQLQGLLLSWRHRAFDGRVQVRLHLGDGVDTAVNEGDEVTILPAVAGG